MNYKELGDLCEQIAFQTRPHRTFDTPVPATINPLLARLRRLVNGTPREPQRMWVNQPSKLQPHHDKHGMNVLAIREEGHESLMRVYFLSGNTLSQQMPRLSLSEGWL